MPNNSVYYIETKLKDTRSWVRHLNKVFKTSAEARAEKVEMRKTGAWWRFNIRVAREIVPWPTEQKTK